MTTQVTTGELPPDPSLLPLSVAAPPSLTPNATVMPVALTTSDPMEAVSMVTRSTGQSSPTAQSKGMPASQQVRLGRKRPLPSCPNPLFLQWLTELRDDAKGKGLKLQYVYQKAISSLNKYPLPLQNAREAKILQSFGDGICKILDQKLQRYLRENGPDAPIHSLPEGAPPAGRQDNNSLDPSRKVGKYDHDIKGTGATFVL
ncbi:crossover junction endonuclease MUS81 [Notothenia coriiceps]|uniref:Crossover junction endonuclease MUS81 n=1 Tax=Notothenia coriiceps TaxID=8208 RepID=A0A6I9PSH1_9TELE|nr:PREDICTED: crossover junction endonuclease MUS81 [Notothenia coriiceps]